MKAAIKSWTHKFSGNMPEIEKGSFKQSRTINIDYGGFKLAQSKASINSIYAEIKMLRREVELIRTALIPEEKVSDEEMAEILDIDAKMRLGERTRLNEALAELNV